MRKVKVDGWDPAKITWTVKEGTKGPYERPDKQDNTDYQLLLKDLQEHDLKMRKDGFFYWLFDRQDAVGRKNRSIASFRDGSAESADTDFRRSTDKSRADHTLNRQVCEILVDGSKNLVKVETREKQAAGATELTKDAKSLIFEFAWWMKKQGYAESTIKSRVRLLRVMVKRGAVLNDPESIKSVIAKQDTWSPARKEAAVTAYSTLLRLTGGTWDPPCYRRVEKLPFIPLERELDELIAGCSKKISAFLQLLKETGMRAGEASNLKWTEVDLESGTVRITPEKRSRPRIFAVSNKLLNVLACLDRNSWNLFGYGALDYLRRTFERQRKRLARKL